MTTPTENTDPLKLVREGTSQDGRLPEALDPAYAPVNERTVAHSMVFAQSYAALLKYFDEKNIATGDWAPFFGKLAYTMTLAARLRIQSGASLLPVSCERLPHGSGYRLKIWPPIATVPEESPPGASKDEILATVTQINRAIEAIVMSQPGQYLWGYSRYKSPRKGPL